MGQSIDLTQMEGETQAVSESIEKQRRAIHDERQKRIVEIRAKLESMTVSELVAAVLEAQVGRVETYREYDE